MATDWNSVVVAVQAALDGITNGPLTQAELNAGVAAREALKAAGAAYDVGSVDGTLNTTAYAASVNAWAAAAKPAWIEADRMARAILQIVGNPPQYALAAFGMSGVRPWTALTTYSGKVAVIPTTPNGYAYIGGPHASGATEPPWPTVIGQFVLDSIQVWTCAAVATGSLQPLPWDITLQTVFTLNTRSDAADIMTAAPTYAGLQSLNVATFAAWTSALATKPAADPVADALSLTVNNNLTAAIASANAWLAATAFH